MTPTRAELATRLVEAGHQIPSGVPGVYGRSGEFEAILTGVSQAFRGLREQPAEVVQFPPVVPVGSWLKTDYLESFPQLAGALHVFSGTDKDHRAMVATQVAGGEWHEHLHPSELMMVPAGCHPLYPMLAGGLPQPRRFDLMAHCFRHESEEDPLRMVTFRMHEQVYAGEPDGAIEHRELWLGKLVDLLRGLGLEVEVDVANDPFFGRAGRMLASGQREEALKFEVLSLVAGESPTAIASGNAHRSHFGENFGITLTDGSPAHTSCAGIGLERTTIALLARHGMATSEWPAEVRKRLGL
ncbi:MAG: hypothetical protein LWW86_08900 [Micrococcales bacterium]|nr:hypothetical protein [Micrococcales bacterium]